MLRDITITSAKLNSATVPCIRNKHINPQKQQTDRKKVQFDSNGIPTSFPASAMLIVAMKGEKQQQKRAQVNGTSTPKKNKPLKPEIGSSSTWGQSQLDLFNVNPPDREVTATKIIPEKWFDFTRLENYQSGTKPLWTVLTVARNDLDAVQQDDLRKDTLLYQKSGRFYATFSSFRQLQKLKATSTSKENLAEKRHEKNVRVVSEMPPPVSKDPSLPTGPTPPPPSQEEVRIASISDPERSSAGSKLFHACREDQTHEFATLFCRFAILALFHDSPSLSWVTGRSEAPQLEWRGG